MDKLNFKSRDLAADNIEKLAALFPSAITELRGEDGELKKGVNFQTLKQLLSPDVADGEECYEFTWVGKREAAALAVQPTERTLRPVPEESRDWETTQNLYLQGDNLEVLKILQESYLGRVKMVYIDPPYNTGRDFLYPDRFQRSQEEEDRQAGVYDEDAYQLMENTPSNGRFHSDWCSMIYPRLLLARNLLSEDGVILINMDEHEIAALSQICAEVFGESNDLGTIVWDKRNPKGDAQGISCQHEYILVYAKNREVLTETCGIKRPKKNVQAMLDKAKQLFDKVGPSYTLEDANADYAAWVREQPGLSGGERAYRWIDGQGDVYRTVSMAWPNKSQAPEDYFVPLIHPVTGKPCPLPERGWRNPSATMKRLLKEGKIVFGKDETTVPNRKYLLKENRDENIPSLLYYGGSDTELLAQMGIPFDTPKVVDVCMEHIRAFTKENDLIMDFFSGSATTAHAVMACNGEDGGHRRFLMVQLPEPCGEKSAAYRAGFRDICAIGMERIRRAGDRLRQEYPEAGLDVGFRVFQVEESVRKEVRRAPGEFAQEAIGAMIPNLREDCTDLDLLYACLLDWGVEIHLPHTSRKIDGCTIHTVDGGALSACFDACVPDSVVRSMAEEGPRRAVFRDSAFPSDAAKLNVAELFKALSPDTQVKVI